MPMLPGYEAIRATVAGAVARAGFELRRLESLLTDPEWQLWLLESLPSAMLALVDVTDHNPFVMYELGLTHSRRLPSILLMNSRNARLPATVLGSPFLPYDEKALDSTETALASWMTLQAEALRIPVTTRPAASDDASYRVALALFEQFCADSSVSATPVARDEYSTRWRVAAARGDEHRVAASIQWLSLQMLPRIVPNSDEAAVMKSLVEWSLSNRPAAVSSARMLR